VLGDDSEQIEIGTARRYHLSIYLIVQLDMIPEIGAKQ